VKSLLFFLFLLISSFALANECPQQLVVGIDCTDNGGDFQLLKHLGKYTQPRMEVEPSNSQMVCSYGVSEWVSKYKIVDGLGEKTVTVTSTEQLVGVANVIRQKGFKMDYFDRKTGPFTMVTFRNEPVRNEPAKQNRTPDQMFLFSGLESTFGKDNLAVTTGNKISTVIINERYLKSQDAATDTFVTGSNCVVMIK
jgi:hypothetical protein